MRKFLLIAAWLSVTGALSAVLAGSLRGDGRRLFLPGDTTSAHHQIEDECDLCHTPAAGLREDACIGCHEAELDHVDDSHPPSKFLDPRQYAIVAELDARRCETCHREHQPELTDENASTQPPGFCSSCHADIGTERPSHAGLAFSSCQDAGCHNFHDNRALTENFLEDHRGEPALLPAPRVEVVDLASHQMAGVACDACHQVEGVWKDRPGDASCAGCHEHQAETFALGKHGMRAAAGLGRMRPGLARLPMKASAARRELGCTSCHGAHDFDTRRAAVEACLECHDDEHSRAYQDSPHFRLWQEELAGTLPPGAGVSCATCHLPRERSLVSHNQSAMMRPAEKMLRPVCSSCHGVDFALAALADEVSVRRNFRGQPKPRPTLSGGSP